MKMSSKFLASRSILTTIGSSLLRLSDKKRQLFVGEESVIQIISEASFFSDLVNNGFQDQSFGYGIRLYIVQYLLPSIEKYLSLQVEHILSMKQSLCPLLTTDYGSLNQGSDKELDIEIIDYLATSIKETRSRICQAKATWSHAENELYDNVVESAQHETVQIQELNTAIKKYCEQEFNVLREEERHMHSIIASLTAIFSAYWEPRGIVVKLTPFGSFTTSLFCGEESDLDISFALYDKAGRKFPIISGGRRRLEMARKKNQKKSMARKFSSTNPDQDHDDDDVVPLFADDILREIVTALQMFKNKRTDFTAGQVATSNRASVVKTRHKIFNRNVDICLNNEVSVMKSKLVAKFVRFDSRVRELMLAIKFWTANRGCNKAVNSMLNSYSWNILVIYFLQKGCGDTPVLPKLVELSPDHGSNDETFVDHRGKKMALGNLDSERSCCYTTAELLIRFFLFYGSSGESECFESGRTFHVLEEIASIRKGEECLSNSDDDSDGGGGGSGVPSLTARNNYSQRIEEEDSDEDNDSSQGFIPPYTFIQAQAAHSSTWTTPSLDEIANNISNLLESNPNLPTSSTVWRMSIADPLESDDPAKRIRSVEAQCFLLDELRRGVRLFRHWFSSTDCANNNVFGDGLWEALMKRNSNVPMFANNRCMRCKQPCFHLTFLAGQGSATPSGYMTDFSLERSRRDDLPSLIPISSKPTSNSETVIPERASANPTHTAHSNYKAAITANYQDKKVDKIAGIPSVKVARATPDQDNKAVPPSVKPGVNVKALTAPTNKKSASASPSKSKAMDPTTGTRSVMSVSTSSVISKTDTQTNSIPNQVNTESMSSIIAVNTVEPASSITGESNTMLVNCATGKLDTHVCTEMTKKMPTSTAGDKPLHNASGNALSAVTIVVQPVEVSISDPIANRKQTLADRNPNHVIKEPESALTNKLEKSTGKKKSKTVKKAMPVPITPKQTSNTATAPTSTSTLTKKDPKKQQVSSVDRNNTENNALGTKNLNSELQIIEQTTISTTVSTKSSKKKAKKSGNKKASSKETSVLLGQGALLGLLLISIGAFYFYVYNQ